MNIFLPLPVDLENYTKDNTDRYHFNAVVSDQDLMEVDHICTQKTHALNARDISYRATCMYPRL